MQSQALEFLQELVDIPSPSGFEQSAQRLVREQLSLCTNQVTTDVLGNVVGIINPGGYPTVLLVGHCDEVGLMVRYITDEGFIYVAPIGGIYPQVATGQRVTIVTEQGPVSGVINSAPVEKDHQKTQLKLEDLWIDIGTKDKSATQALVAVGDPAVLSPTFLQLNDDIAIARGFDDKIGSFIVTEVLRQLNAKNTTASVVALSSVQEEIGSRGAQTAAFQLLPQIGIAVDVTDATDHPGIEKKKSGDISLGSGPVLHRGANVNPVLGKLLIEAAKHKNIPYQRRGDPKGTGTDANVLQVNKEGMATALVSIPLRYMHTPCEMLSLSDVDNAIKLLVAFIETLGPACDFTPV